MIRINLKNMLENFGIKDLFIAIKKNIKLLLSCAAILSVVFIFFTYKYLKNANGVYYEGKSFFVSSFSCYVSPNMKNISNDNADSYYRDLPDDYIALMNTDNCAKYIYSNLLLNHNVAYLNTKSGFDFSGDTFGEGENWAKKLYKVKRDNKSMVFSVYSNTHDKELSKEVLNLCKQYLEQNIEINIKDAELKISDDSFKIVKSLKELDGENEASASDNQNQSKYKNIFKIVIKKAVIPVIAIMIIIMFILTLKSFFNPTMNRKTDFAKYDLPILGEIKY